VKLHNYLLAFFVIFFLSGCSNYTYNNRNFQSADAALSAHENDIALYTTQIAQSTVKISGKALVITPTKKTTEALGITSKNSPPPAFIDYLGRYMEREYLAFSEYLKASNAFDDVVSQVVDHPAVYAKNAFNDYAATVYLHMLSPTQVSWYLITPNTDEPQQINIDNLANTGPERINSWVKDIVSKTGGKQ
jgi:hypothetical protein